MSRRESESEDEKFNDDNQHYRYTRDELLNIRLNALSSQRPSYLSNEFDNEEGKFVPEKWLEYRWMCEGVENRPSAGTRRKDKLKAEALEADSTVLSPQRRAFSSGCRAASPIKNENEPERLAANKGNWRSGAGFLLKNSSSADFKPAFQKSTSASSESFTKTRLTNGGGSASNGNWRTTGDTAFRPNFHKDHTQSRAYAAPSCGDEKMPEWLNDGPTSMCDMIELKGFDDEQKTKRPLPVKNKRETVANKQLQQAQQRAAAASRASASTTSPKEPGSRASSRDSASNNPSTTGSEPPSSEEHPSISGVSIPPDLAASMSPILNGKLPNSDAEFAAIIGILGESDLDTLKQKSASSAAVEAPTPSVTGSRLSRFFTTPLNTEHHTPATVSNDSNNNTATSRTSPSSGSAPSANPVLQKIFSSSPQRSVQSPVLSDVRGVASVPGAMRVEDLERGFQREAVSNLLNMGTLQREAVTSAIGDRSEHLRALGIDSRATHYGRQLPSPHISKGNQFVDQAHLVNRINKFAHQQEVVMAPEEVGTRSMRSAGSPPSPIHTTLPLASASNPAQLVAQAAAAQGIQHAHKLSGPHPEVALQAALMRSQYEAAIVQSFQALAANQQRASAMTQSPQTADLNAVRAMVTGMMTTGSMQQTGASGGAQPPGTQIRPSTTLPSAFMPTSVMRQMTKNNATLEEKHRRSLATANASNLDGDRHDAHADNANTNAQKQSVDVPTSNNMDMMAKLALQQQYAQVMAAMQGGLSMGAWRQPAQMAATMRAQALAAIQAEQQRQFAMAMMRGDLNQAQAIRARFLTHQAAAVANMPNLVAAGHRPPQQMPTPILGANSVPSNTISNHSSVTSSMNTAPLKFQNPLEKLLQSAGVPTCQTTKTVAQDSSSGGAGSSSGTSGMPSIISRLPPSANCISVEELERQFATN
uniref:Eukaryotic translation initiation factor 4E transporter n=5 Tax=Parascaris univalens TaxID=6257 RepID=A0A915BJS0_PARUN